MLLKCVALIMLGLAMAAAKAINGAHQAGQTDGNMVDLVVSLLDNREKCTLPTYEEIDVAAKQLEQDPEAARHLAKGGQLLRETVLDQWHSFQKHLRNDNVLKSAKKRAFLSRVEQYQERKFSHSICAQEPDARTKLS